MEKQRLANFLHVPISLVKDLRQSTGLSIKACREALIKANFDVEAARLLVLKSWPAFLASKEGRVTKEGLIGAYINGNRGAIVEVNTETDFTSLNQEFRKLVLQISELAVTTDGHLEQVRQAVCPQNNQTIQEKIDSVIALTREQIVLRRSKVLVAETGIVTKYVHSTTHGNSSLGNVGALVALESQVNPGHIEQLGKLLAMHVVASHGQENSKMARYPSEDRTEHNEHSNVDISSLYRQVYLMDNSGRTVFQVLKDIKDEVGCPVILKGCFCFRVGEELNEG